MMLRRILKTKRKEITDIWRKLYNEELYNIFSSQNNIRIIKIKRTCRTYGRVQKCI
jgi:hypothetical protein